MFELRRCRGAAGDESGEARAEWFELRRGPLFEQSGGPWPTRGEVRVDAAGDESGEARAE
jgi:hypothetical protein